MADISKIKTPDGVTYDIKDTAGRREAYFEWGGKNITGDIAPMSMAISTEHNANRLAFLNPAAINIEYTTNGGSTWSDSGYTDADKTWVCTGTQFIAIGQSKASYSASAELTTNHWTRITLTGQNGTTQYVYTSPRKLLINMSTALAINCLVEYKTGVSGAEWKTFGTYAVSGWSGWNDIPLVLSTFGGGTTQTSNYWYLRFTFKVNSTRTDNYKGYAGLYGLRLFGTTNWSSASSNYGKGPISDTGHLYSYNSNADATFPAKLIAPKIETGTAEGNYFQSQKFRGQGDAYTYYHAVDWGYGGHDHVDFYEYGGVFNFHKHTGASISSGDTLLGSINSNGWDGKVNGHTVNADVPSGAKFTDTTYTGTSPISINGSNQVSIATASTSAYGATKLSTATNSTAVDVAATPSAVKTAYDLANSANTTAGTALSGVNGNLIYDHTFTISNGVATFTPHVYQKGTEVTTNYAKSCFTWKYRLIDGSEVSLTTKNDRGCDVTITNLGYGGHVIGIFTPA